MEINILIHGYKEGFNSQFMQFLYTSLKNAGKVVYGFDFDYIENNNQPSLDFKEEHNKLIKIIEGFKSKGYTKINLIGKSLGGTFCLNQTITNDPCINKIIIVGFPYVLGYPANLELLKSKPVVEGHSTFEDYKNQFSKLGDTLSKLTIIQGGNDILGSLNTLRNLIDKTNNNIKLFTIKNASHGFKPIDSSTTIEENYNSLFKILSSIL